jgi:D-glucosaminate-6-phosphate ammonia-lyase
MTQPGRTHAAGAAAADGTPEVYHRLGLRRCINAVGHVTALGGSLMPARVLAAMAEAATAFVPLEELHAAAGRRIAELTGAAAALVSTGAAGSIVLGAAACIAGADRERIRRLPDTTGIANRILVPPTPGLTWVHYARLAGGVATECADADSLRRAAGEGQAAMLFYMPSVHGEGPVSLEEMLDVARQHGVPCMVDAADKLPPLDSLRRYLDAGADLVAFSGGKGLWGPQDTGLLLGRVDLIRAAYLNSCPPGIGRPMKVGKEEIAGVVAALELYLERDHAAEAARWEAQLRHVEERLAGVPGVRCEWCMETRIAEGVRLKVHLPAGLNTGAARQALAEGTPRVMVGVWDDALEIDPQTLQPGEERDLAEALARVLSGRAA